MRELLLGRADEELVRHRAWVADFECDRLASADVQMIGHEPQRVSCLDLDRATDSLRVDGLRRHRCRWLPISLRAKYSAAAPTASATSAIADQIGVLRNALAQRRMQNLLGGLPGCLKRRRRSALVTTLTLLIAIAAAARTGFSSTPKNGYSRPIATGISTML